MTTRRTFLGCVALASGVFIAADAARGTEPASVLMTFRQGWDHEAWGPSGSRRRPGYMRHADDEGWQVRHAALVGLVAGSKASVAPLLDALEQGDVPARMLAAQALSFLAPQVDRDPLLRAVRDDAEPAVRLYAVDALGRSGDATLRDELLALQEREPNRDVRQHIGYALQRSGHGVPQELVDALVASDSEKVNTARVGRPAPDFDLTSLSGDRVRLSDFRGRKPVVLVFIYGDT